MVLNSRVLALAVALGVSGATALVLYILNTAQGTALWVTFLVVLIVTFFLVVISLEFFVFRQLRRARKLLERGRNGEPEKTAHTRVVLAPVKNLGEEITTYTETTQKEIEKLRKLEAFRQEFVANVSHELKTPIFAAQGFLHTLLDGAEEDEGVRKKFLRKAAKSLDALDELVQDLLVLSQIETGQIKMKPGKTDLMHLAEEVLDQLEERAAKKGIRLRIQSDQPRQLAYADELRIGQVLTNLVSNAIKHSFEGGEVIVGLVAGKKKITVRVTDFGEGIPDDLQHRIFERFYRVDKSRSREKGGTGLGLSIVKHILESHSSRANVKSTVGKGSVFSFRLKKYTGGDSGK